MKDLNIRQEAIKILKEKAGKNLFDRDHTNFLLNTAPEARETKAKMNYWDLIKIKSFFTAKETMNKTKKQQTIPQVLLLRPNYLKVGVQEASLLVGCLAVTNPSTAWALPLRLG